MNKLKEINGSYVEIDGKNYYPMGDDVRRDEKREAEGPNSCRLLIEMLRLSCDYLGMKFAGKILVKAYEKGEIQKNQKALRKAFDLGMSL